MGAKKTLKSIKKIKNLQNSTIVATMIAVTAAARAVATSSVASITPGNDEHYLVSAQFSFNGVARPMLNIFFLLLLELRILFKLHFGKITENRVGHRVLLFVF